MAKEPKDTGEERDLGDSAGYGQGGSAKDYHDVMGEERLPRELGPNPLDEVVRTEKGGRDGRSSSAPEKKPLPEA